MKKQKKKIISKTKGGFKKFNKVFFDDLNAEIIYFGSFPPRECGIATFTRDLTLAMDKNFMPGLTSKILAINDSSSIYNYNQKVKYQINETDVEDYISVAKKINNDSSVKLINIEHEFGLYGGIFGDYLIAFLETVKKPVAVTFHSIIPNPSERLKRVVKSIYDRSCAVIVMAETAIKILKDNYNLETSKVFVIPHGVPTVKFQSNQKIKKELGLEGRIVLSTFGLINKGKGIEYAIKALPKIIKKNPKILYLVIGETHPQVRKREGETYRNRLVNLVKKNGLAKNVKFYNKYLTLQEIICYLQATDIYICPSLDCNQIVSGTLSYAMGAGKVIIATPSLYAKEILANKRGILVKIEDSVGIAKAINFLLERQDCKREMEERAYQYSRKMIWDNVATKHLEVFKTVVKIKEKAEQYKFLPIKINHLITLTDDVGIIQHAKHSVNDRRSGYTVDDNSRALIATLMYYERFKDKASFKLINTYLSFLYHAQKKDGKFHNLMDYNRNFLDQVGSEDCFGRALWATGFLLASDFYENVKMTARFIFDNAVKNCFKLKSPRAIAFSIIGLYYYYQTYPEKNIKDKIKKLADELADLYKRQSSKDWKWYEEIITYSNGRLPESLFLAYRITKNKTYLKIAKESLDFLADLVILDGRLVLIGHSGWYNQRGKRAFYDQQPIDAASMAQVFMTAYEITKDKKYYNKAVLSFQWFLGKNSIEKSLYDEVTGGCFDGLLPSCVNLNQGAESTISYLLARMSFNS